MTSLAAQLKSFDPNDIVDLHEKLTHQNWALRSLGALIESADMGKHFSDHEQKGKYRSGLNQIVTLCLDRQEAELNKIRIKALHSPERIIMDAWRIRGYIYLDDTETRLHILDSIRTAFIELNEVLLKFGNDYYARAKKVKNKLRALEKTTIMELQQYSKLTPFQDDESLELYSSRPDNSLL